MHLPNSGSEKSSEMKPSPPPTPFFISNDIIFNILMKLPVKSLLRFKCVCKNWNSIIKSQTFKLKYTFFRSQAYIFIHFHQDSSIPSQPCTVFWENSFTKISKLEIPSTLSDPSLNSVDQIVLGSCRGLLFITNFIEFGRELYVWNPSIRKHKILTSSSLFTGRFRRRFNHPKTSIAVALGYDSKINDFKIVRIASFNGKSRAEIYVFCRDSWRSMGLAEDLKKRFVEIYSWHYEYINGCFYWLARFVNEGGEYYISILRFDFEEERFIEVKLPNDYLNGIGCYTQSLVILNGFLGVIVNGIDKDGENVYCIWRMNNGSLWTQQNVRFDGRRSLCGCVGDKLVLAEEDNAQITTTTTRILLFDPQTLEEKRLNILRPVSVHPFAESFALL